MPVPSVIADVFAAVDAKDASQFVTYLTPDAVFRYGNSPPVTGQEATRQAVAQFFQVVHALHHELLETWVHADMVFCKGEVTYIRHDGSTVGPLPFFNLFKMRGDRIAEYLIYADVTPLLAS